MSDLHKSKRFDLIDMFNDNSRYINDIYWPAKERLQSNLFIVL